MFQNFLKDGNGRMGYCTIQIKNGNFLKFKQSDSLSIKLFVKFLLLQF
jgi:hypothetical protein